MTQYFRGDPYSHFIPVRAGAHLQFVRTCKKSKRIHIGLKHIRKLDFFRYWNKYAEILLPPSVVPASKNRFLISRGTARSRGFFSRRTSRFILSAIRSFTSSVRKTCCRFCKTSSNLVFSQTPDQLQSNQKSSSWNRRENNFSDSPAPSE